MIRARSFLLGFKLSLVAAFTLAQTKPCPTLETNVVDRKYAPGQVWNYQTRPNDPESTLTILEIDLSEKVGIIIHVRVDGLQMNNPRGEVVPTIEHMPFTRDAMLLSTTQLIRVIETLPTMEGYYDWRSHCGGVYTISVADAVAVDEKTLNQR